MLLITYFILQDFFYFNIEKNFFFLLIFNEKKFNLENYWLNLIFIILKIFCLFLKKKKKFILFVTIIIIFNNKIYNCKFKNHYIQDQ